MNSNGLRIFYVFVPFITESPMHKIIHPIPFISKLKKMTKVDEADVDKVELIKLEFSLTRTTQLPRTPNNLF
jgi:hypothetical protein